MHILYIYIYIRVWYLLGQKQPSSALGRGSQNHGTVFQDFLGCLILNVYGVVDIRRACVTPSTFSAGKCGILV